MIIDITTGFFPCTGHKPGRPWLCLADSGAGARAYVSSIWTCERHRGPASTAASRGTNSGGGGPLMRAPTARVTWGFPVTKPVLQRLQHTHTQLLKHQKSLIACSKSVSVCTADLPSARKQRAKRGDTADTLSISSLNNARLLPTEGI